ncbi:MAG TPA: TetR family transcriptional regulator, partial [Geminicoccaceae bacterium]
MDRRPSSGRARGERGEATRERLLLAAIDVFGRRGFEASTRELAGAAGVNLAAIPYHFGSKHGL